MYCPYCMNHIELGETHCEACGKNPSSYKSESHHIPCGYILNERYEIGRVLEEGELGLVYIAVDKKSERKVFIKEYFPMNDAYRDLDIGIAVKCCIGSEVAFEQKREKFVAIASSLIRRDNISEMLYDRAYFTANHSVYLMMDFSYDTVLGQLVEQNRWDEVIEVYKELWKKEEQNIYGTVPAKKKKTIASKASKDGKEKSLKVKIGIIIAEVIGIIVLLCALVFAILVVTHEHAYGEWMITKNATCTSVGERRRVCVCGEEEIEVIEEMGHTVVIDEAVEATCVKDGLTEGSHCSVCNEVLVAQEVIEMTGHTVVTDEAVEATCVKSGLTEGSHCAICGEVFTEQKTVKALGHSVSDGSCVRCGDGASEGLTFVLKEDDTYEVNKIGTCKDKEIIIPSIYKDKTVTSIGAQAFSYCDTITSVTIPSTVTTIESGAFSNCSSLKTISLPSSITNIGKEAFYRCESLSSITIPSYVETIGNYAFSECDALTRIVIPSSVKDMGEYTFSECDNLKTVIFREGLETIGSGAFYNCISITSVTMTSKIKTIGESAFENCEGLKKIVIPINVTTIEKKAFANCNNLRVYAEAESKPSGWNNSWKTYWVKVTWGYEG